MRYTRYILLALLLSSCVDVKKSHSEEHTVNSDTSQSNVQQVNNISSDHSQHDVVDSTLGIKGSAVQGVFTPDMLQPWKLADGGKAPKTYELDSDQTHLRIVVDTNGRLHVRCSSDSLTIVIKKLERIIETKDQRYDSLSEVKQRVLHTETTKTVTHTVKRTPWWYLLVALGLGAAIPTIIKFIVKLIKFHA